MARGENEKFPLMAPWGITSSQFHSWIPNSHSEHRFPVGMCKEFSFKVMGCEKVGSVCWGESHHSEMERPACDGPGAHWPGLSYVSPTELPGQGCERWKAFLTTETPLQDLFLSFDSCEAPRGCWELIMVIMGRKNQLVLSFVSRDVNLHFLKEYGDALAQLCLLPERQLLIHMYHCVSKKKRISKIIGASINTGLIHKVIFIQCPLCTRP